MKGLWFLVLKSFLPILYRLSDGECKTVGYFGERAKWHCGVCTMGIIHKEVKAAVDFWEKDDLYKSALS